MDELRLDQLPYLAVRHIFKFLSIRDLVACRAVSRKFKFYADETDVQKLVVKDGSEGCGCWHTTRRPIDFASAISWKEFAALKPSQFKLNQQLTSLHIRLDQMFSFRTLTAFKKLAHLELNLLTSDRRTRTLALPELRVLKLVCFRSSFLLKTPKLEVLCCDHIDDLRFECPQTIKRLESDYVGADFMGKFSNVEMFKVKNKVFGLDPALLSAWKHLQEFDIADSCLHLNSPEAFKSSLSAILRQSKTSSAELKFFLDDVQLIDESQLDHYEPNRTRRSNFKLKNHQFLRAPDYDLLSISYNDFRSSVSAMTSDFFEKFPRIRLVKAIGPVNPDEFKWFLMHTKRLSCLKLINTSLDQAFMDSLPSILDPDQLTYLKVDERYPIDFSFILRFRMLFEFESNQASFDLAAKVFRKRPCLRRFQFKDDDEYVEIHRSTSISDAYDLKIYRQVDDEPIRKRTCCELDLKWARLMGVWEQRIVRKLSSRKPVAPVITIVAVRNGKRASTASRPSKKLKTIL